MGVRVLFHYHVHHICICTLLAIMQHGPRLKVYFIFNWTNSLSYNLWLGVHISFHFHGDISSLGKVLRGKKGFVGSHMWVCGKAGWQQGMGSCDARLSSMVCYIHHVDYVW
jgi:hypothetical protein